MSNLTRMMWGIGLALAMLGLLEGALRLLQFPDTGIYRGDPATVWWLRPDLDQFVHHQEMAEDFLVQTGGEGFRGGDPPASGEWWLALGCSTTFGWGVEAEEAWPALLSQELGFPVVNGGVPGWSTHQAVRGVEAWSHLKPSGVLIALNVRDVSQAAQPDHEVLPSPWVERLNLMKALRKMGATGRGLPNPEGPVRVPVERYRANLQALESFYGDTPVVFLAFPSLKPGLDHRRVLREVGGLDLPELPESAFFEADPIHLNARGHRLLSQLLATRIAPQEILLPQKKTP